MFLADAERLLKFAHQAETTVKRASQGKTGRVRIGFTGAAGYELIPELLVAAKQALPEIDVVLLELISVAQIEAFASNTIDLGVMRPVQGHHELASVLVDEEPLVVALPASHPLCALPRLELAHLHEQPFIMHSPVHGKYFYDRIMALLANSDIRLDIVQYIDQSPTILSLVRAGLGLSILPASAQRFHYDRVEFRQMAGVTARAEMNMAWRTDQDNPAVVAFRSLAVDHFAAKRQEDQEI